MDRLVPQAEHTNGWDAQPPCLQAPRTPKGGALLPSPGKLQVFQSHLVRVQIENRGGVLTALLGLWNTVRVKRRSHSSEEDQMQNLTAVYRRALLFLSATVEVVFFCGESQVTQSLGRIYTWDMNVPIDSSASAALSGYNSPSKVWEDCFSLWIFTRKQIGWLTQAPGEVTSCHSLLISGAEGTAVIFFLIRTWTFSPLQTFPKAKSRLLCAATKCLFFAEHFHFNLTYLLYNSIWNSKRKHADISECRRWERLCTWDARECCMYCTAYETT